MSENEELMKPGFVVVVFDVPYAVSLPNGAYLTLDPEKGIACVELTLKEGSRAFFRNRPITGPTSFKELQIAAQQFSRPRLEYSYVAISDLADGTKKATLNIHCGEDGGFAECKYFSCVTVTFLADDVRIISQSDKIMQRIGAILNPFLNKYRLLNEDYKVSGLALERNFYLASCHTSPLEQSELAMSTAELFDQLFKVQRKFETSLGRGGANILKPNSFELLGPRSQLPKEMLGVFQSLVMEDYSMPLSYEFILEALRCLQKSREFRLAIVHAETAFEVYVSDSLIKLMRDSGLSESDALSTVESNGKYWGIKNRLRRLDEWAQMYSTSRQLPFAPFVDSAQFKRWNSTLYANRNRAVHEGAGNVNYQDAWEAIGTAKECIVLLEQRIPGVAHWICLNPSMIHFRDTAGEISF
ncbi:MAG TPA: hypothetical protein VFB82_07720 [Blastocatellia bacterium]|nr:hypothetical protein [Blastocatellia bacterium]